MLRKVVPPARTRFIALRVRHDHDVVLIGALRTEAFRSQHPDDGERHVFDAQDLADGIFVAENLRGGGLADDADLVGAPHVLRGEGCAVRERPLAEVEIIRRFAVDAGEPVLIARRDLRGRDDFLAHARDRRDLAADGFRVLDFQRARAAPAGANAARGRAAGENQDDVLAEARDLRLHLRLRAIADADHRDDRADADDDAERGERGAQLVSPQSARRRS